MSGTGSTTLKGSVSRVSKKSKVVVEISRGVGGIVSGIDRFRQILDRLCLVGGWRCRAGSC